MVLCRLLALSEGGIKQDHFQIGYYNNFSCISRLVWLHWRKVETSSIKSKNSFSAGATEGHLKTSCSLNTLAMSVIQHCSWCVK